MNKQQAYHKFWADLTDWGVYDENSVPDDAQLPYITHETPDGFFGDEMATSVSLWDRSASWSSVVEMADQIAEIIGYGGIYTKIGGVRMWIKRGIPWAQRLSEPNDDTVRRIVLNLTVEYMEET